MPCFSRRLAFVTCAVALCGCSEPPTVLVRGTVTHDGQPLEGATVTFINGKESGRPAFGVTDAQGRYELSTHLHADEFIEGAFPDEYAVIFRKVRYPQNTQVRMKMSQLGGKGIAALQRYLKEEAIHDLWPDGVPEGWPPGYIPGVVSPPKMGRGSPEARRIARLVNGLTLIPLRYSDPRAPCYQVSVDHADEEPLIFDFELFGEPDDDAPPPSEEPKLPSEDEVAQAPLGG